VAKIMFPAGEGGEFPLLEDGIYKLKISDPKLAYSRKEGAAVVECRLEVMEGKHRGDRLPHSYSLQPQAMWRLKMDMRALGILDPATYPLGQSFELEDDDIVDMLADAEGPASIFIDVYKGAPRSKLAVPGFLTAEQVAERAPKPALKSEVGRKLPAAQEPY